MTLPDRVAEALRLLLADPAAREQAERVLAEYEAQRDRNARYHELRDSAR